MHFITLVAAALLLVISHNYYLIVN